MNILGFGKVRGSQQNYFSENEIEPLMLNNRGELLVSYGALPYKELSASSNGYEVRTTTAVAPVVAVPTTAALIALWNGENDEGRSYIIDSISLIVVAATAAFIQSPTILVNISQIPTQTNTTANLTVRPLRGTQPYRGNAKIATNASLNATDGIAANWFPMGNNSPLAGATNGTSFGSCTDVDCRGLLIIPPKNIIGISALSTTATATSVQLAVRWYEVVLPPVV